jgi:hypothetical protein
MSLFRIPPGRGPVGDNNGTIEDIGIILDKLAGYMKQYEMTGDFRFLNAAIGLHQDMRTTFDSYDWNLRKELKKSEAYKRMRPIVKTKRLGA